MDWAMMIWSMMVASVTVWRLSQWFCCSGRYNRRFLWATKPENFFGDRMVDCICWLNVLLSAQTALWVAGGLTGMVLIFSLGSGMRRLFTPHTERICIAVLPTISPLHHGTESPHGDFSCLTVEHGMRANHG